MNRFQGDPKIYLTHDGATGIWTGGQPEMTQSIVQEMLLRLYTKSGWHGNAFTNNKLKKLGSRFEEECTKQIDSQTPNRVIFAAQEALAPMTDANYLRATFDIVVSNPTGREIKTVIQAFSPVIGNAELGLIKYAETWQATAKEL